MKHESFHELGLEGWQQSDETHPISGGMPGYRIVFKTLKLIPYPDIKLEFENLRIYIRLDRPTRGGVNVRRTLHAREADTVILPEYIDCIKQEAKTVHVSGKTDMSMEYDAYEDHLGHGAYVEFLLRTTATNSTDILNEGRQELASLKALLEFHAGPRLLGIPVAEEVGRVFDDWHWNRQIFAKTLQLESQLGMQPLHGERFLETVEPAIQAYLDADTDVRRRLTLASEWYWKADGESDLVSQFLELWFAIEALEMPDGTNIRPVRERLAQVTATNEALWRRPLGTLYGLRSRLVHGAVRGVTKSEVAMLRVIVEVLLEARLTGPNRTDTKVRLLATVQSSEY